ncbi:hypothetical protein GGR54DRAFT_27038 [Hypoxylon sp. NC1633]|nr:hypothetical protein GGR54DRAFT_27038 [Hypoxylon sp. NC1633]
MTCLAPPFLATPSPTEASPFTNIKRDPQSSQPNDSDTFNKTATSLSVEWIVGIVVITLAVLIGIGLAIWCVKRRNRKRRERLAQFNVQSEPIRLTPTPGKKDPPVHEVSGIEVRAEADSNPLSELQA